MNNIKINRLNDGIASLTPEALVGLRAALGGQALLPGDSGYDQARTVWNATVDKRPGLVVRCAGPSDVVQAVRFVIHEIVNQCLVGKLLHDQFFVTSLWELIVRIYFHLNTLSESGS